jgi:hypothetical protein
MGVHDAVLVGVLVVLALIMRFPDQYRSGMARLCSVEEDRIPPYPRQAAIALSIFLRIYSCFGLSSLSWLAIVCMPSKPL